MSDHNMNLCECGYVSSPNRTRCIKCGKPFAGQDLEANWKVTGFDRELEGKAPLVIYFENDADREEFIEAFKLAKPSAQAFQVMIVSQT